MSAQGRLDPEQLLADARGGRPESLGRVLELNRAELALLARRKLIFTSRAGSMPRTWSRRRSSMPAATFTTSAARAIGNASPGCARSCSITWPASSRGKSRRRNEVPGGKCRWTSGSRQWSGPREQSRSRPRSSAARPRPAATPGAASAQLASPISWLDCPPTIVKCSSCGTSKGCRSPRWPAAWAGLPEPSASSGCARSISFAGCCKWRNSYEGDRAPGRGARANERSH